MVATAAAGPVPAQSNKERPNYVRTIVVIVVATGCVWWHLGL